MVWKMTNQQIKKFYHMFLRNYIIDNQDFSSYFIYVRLIVSPLHSIISLFFCFNQSWFIVQLLY